MFRDGVTVAAMTDRLVPRGAAVGDGHVVVAAMRSLYGVVFVRRSCCRGCRGRGGVSDRAPC